MTGLDLGRLVADFGDPQAETLACRQECALFDFSFLARARVQGPRARQSLAEFSGRSLQDLRDGRLTYALRVGAEHAVESDLTIWSLGGDCFELMSGRRADVRALRASCHASSAVHDLSAATSVLSVQGPGSLAAFEDLLDLERLARLPYFGHAEFLVHGHHCRIGRLGYTGERGFEVVAPRGAFAELWRLLARRARPAGFAAADCLRIESGFLLFLNECRAAPTPSELGLQGLYQRAHPPARIRLSGFTAHAPLARAPWQPSQPVIPRPRRGEIAVTSACFSPALRSVIGLGFVIAAEARPGARVRDPCSGFGEVVLAALPFVDPHKQRPRGGWLAGPAGPVPGP